MVATTGLWALDARIRWLLAAALALTCHGVVACGGTDSRAPQGETGTVSQRITEQPSPSCKYAFFGGHDYWFCTADLKWADAEASCARVGTHLAKIESAAENTFIRGNVPVSAWVSATDAQAEGKWLWASDGTAFWNGGPSGSAVGGAYVSWNLLQPSTSSLSNCGSVDALGKWSDGVCSLPKDYVCESNAASSTFPQAPDSACTRSTRQGHDYWFCSNPRSYADSLQKCRAAAMDLAVVEDDGENSFIRSAIQTDSYVGLTDADNEGAFKWQANQSLAWCGTQTGRTPNSEAYANWAPLFPVVGSVCSSEKRNGRAYWFCNDPRSFDSAKAACESANMKLVRVNDSAENSFLRSKILLDGWLGATDAAAEGSWRWLDGDALFWSGGRSQGGAFTNWGIGEPANSTSKNCMSLRLLGGSWDDQACSGLKGWICEGPDGADLPVPDTADCVVEQRLDGKWRNGECTATAGYVCETPPSNASASLDELAVVREDYFDGKANIGGILAKDGVSLKSPFLKYSKRFGLRECVDTFEATGTARALAPIGLEAIKYRQLYKGMPILGSGYMVRREPTTKAVKTLTGQTIHDLNVDVHTTVTQSNALDAAIAAVGSRRTDYNPTPPGELVLAHTKGSAGGEWQPVWLFTLPPVRTFDGYVIQVSARTGAVVARAPLSAAVSCVTDDYKARLNTDTPQRVMLDVRAYQQRGWGDRGNALATRFSSLPVNPIALYTEGTSIDPNSPLFDKPKIFTGCDSTTPTATTLPVSMVSSTSVDVQPSASAGGTDHDGDFSAALFMTAQRCIEFMASQLDWNAAQWGPWIGWGKDDAGAYRPIDLRVVHGKATLMNSLNWFAQFDPRIETAEDPTRPFIGASLEIVCHELAHGVQSALMPGGAPTVGAGAVAEGIADIIAAAAEAYVRGAPAEAAFPCSTDADCADPTWGQTCQSSICAPSRDAVFCLAGDTRRNATECMRDFDNPKISSGLCSWQASASATPVGSCPDDAKAPEYCPFDNDCTSPGEIGCCWRHANSLIVSHWFSVLTHGKTGKNADGCDYKVEPLFGNPVDMNQAVKEAAQVVFTSMRGSYFSNTDGLRTFAQATLDAAREMYGGTSTKRDSVAEAWFAVGVLPEIFHDGMNGTIYPTRAAERINPWVTFRWPGAEGQTWDFQVSDNAAFATPGLLFSAQTSETVKQDGTTFAAIRVSLPKQSGPFYWRVRPTASGPWLNCAPINETLSTGDPSSVTSLNPSDDAPSDVAGVWQIDADGKPVFAPDTGIEAATGKVRPGSTFFSVNAVDGAASYRVFLTHDSNAAPCAAGAGGVTEIDVPREGIVTTKDGRIYFEVPKLEPSWTYKISARAVGPQSATGGPPPESGCFETTFTTAAMRAPEPDSPQNGTVFRYDSPHDQSGFEDTPLEGLSPLKWHWLGWDGADRFEVSFFTRDAGGNCASSPVIPPVVVSQSCDDNCFASLTADVFPQPNPTGYCWSVVGIADRAGDSASKSPPSDTSYFVYALRHANPLSPGESILSARSTSPIGAGSGTGYGGDVSFTWSRVPGATGYVLKVGRAPWNTPAAQSDPSNCIPPFNVTLPGGRTSCQTGPVSEVTTQNVMGGDTTSLTLPGDAVGKGRYCWTVWPVIDGAVQPFVMRYPYFCYTTEPAKPTLDYSPKVSGSGFNPANITLSATFPFVPDPGIEIHGPQAIADELVSQGWRDPACAPMSSYPFDAPYYDVYNCTYDVVFRPKQGTTYNVTATADGPTSTVASDPLSFSTGTCGARDSDCCTTNPACGANLACVGGKCRCGDTGQVCCGGNSCNANLRCVGGHCQPPVAKLTTILSPDNCGLANVRIRNDGNVPVNNVTYNVQCQFAIGGSIDLTPPFTGLSCGTLAPGQECVQAPFLFCDQCQIPGQIVPFNVSVVSGGTSDTGSVLSGVQRFCTVAINGPGDCSF